MTGVQTCALPISPLREGIGEAPGTYETRYDVSTGVVLDSEGHIVTCAHALEALQGDTAYVTLPGTDHVYQARIIRISSELDLALLKVSISGQTPLPLARTSDTLAGSEVLLAGFPTTEAYADRSNPVYSSGLVSSVEREVRGSEYRPSLARLLEVQAWVDRGFSGGPVISRDGSLVGIVVFRLEKSSQWGGYTLAIPVETVRQFLPDQLRYGLVSESH